MANFPQNTNGQATESNSSPVVVASDQSAIPVTIASVPLPTNAAQETGGHLAAIDTAQGAQADTAWTSGSGSVIALLKAIVGKLAGTVAVSGTFFQTTQPVSIATAPALVASSAVIGKVGIDQTTPGTTNGVQVNAALPAGSNNIGLITLAPATSGGLSVYHLASAASTNLQVPKASAGQLYGYIISNTSAAYSYLCFHNSASTPTAGASIFFKIGIPPGGAANVEFANGIPFSSGIAISTVTGAADNNTTAVALNDLIINLLYK
jgi:hypothetical protein